MLNPNLPSIQEVIENCIQYESKLLNLSNWKLTELPERFWDCTHVLDLDLSGNFLNSEQLERLSTFTNLYWLNLSQTELTKLDFLLPLQDLYVVKLTNTFVTDVSVLGEMLNLSEINLNQCTHIDLDSLTALSNLPYLTNLHIHSSNITDIRMFAKRIMLHNLDLWLNPETMTYPPKQVCEKGMKAINKFFMLHYWLNEAGEGVQHTPNQQKNKKDDFDFLVRRGTLN